ncbi:VPLPA-CTERM sorting domain-containing protein [Sneathiella marina]|uniref:VPLPA-CTERM sorting domain-containing protein n=1 Tax=Sneathiella marina TaxID=2950108 RepID=A0ABY4W535_9PROT|nr:VPLPA-CTERM sorting domain-containing protein [Sneathiella marina]USG62148.1 VPLPA-CTERM sorting domain-containing protein [Sneathiella marina]
MKLISAALAALLLFASPVEASTVFDLRDKGGWSNSFGFSEDGIGLSVYTGRQDGSGVTTNYYDWLYQSNGNGLGMYSSGNSKNREIDGKNANETMQFLFDTAVQLVSITFGKVDSNDDFDFYFDDGSGLTEQEDDIDIPNGGKFAFSDLWIGTLFGIGADGYDDNFTIKKIEVAAVTAIPLPTALSLFGAALLGIGYMARRRRTKV